MLKYPVDENLVHYFQFSFKELLTTLQDRPDDEKSVYQSVFLSIPNNTIQFGLYPVLEVGDYKPFEFQLLHSRIIQSSFARSTTISDEELITLAFYVLFFIIDAIAKLSSKHHSEIKNLITNKISSETDSIYKYKFEENKNLLIEIISDIKNSNALELPDWSEQWKDYLTSQLLINDNYFDIFKKNFGSLKKNLGLDINQSKLIEYFISKSIDFY